MYAESPQTLSTLAGYCRTKESCTYTCSSKMQCNVLQANPRTIQLFIFCFELVWFFWAYWESFPVCLALNLCQIKNYSLWTSSLSFNYSYLKFFRRDIAKITSHIHGESEADFYLKVVCPFFKRRNFYFHSDCHKHVWQLIIHSYCFCRQIILKEEI